jgi:hypothetical protein
MRFSYLLICLVALFNVGVAGESGPIKVMHLEEGAVSPPATIDDIAWLAGHWKGTGLGGMAEDVISPPADGQMMGMFRHLKADGSINFYEFYLFSEKGGSLTQRLKHFSLPLSSWEEKDEYVEFPLVEITEKAAYFDGLTYEMTVSGGLRVGVRIAEDTVAVFDYRRVD